MSNQSTHSAWFVTRYLFIARTQAARRVPSSPVARWLPISCRQLLPFGVDPGVDAREEEGFLLTQGKAGRREERHDELVLADRDGEGKPHPIGDACHITPDPG